MTSVAILRCAKLPSFVNWDIPNLEELFEEDRLLAQGFRAEGFEAEPVVWNDPRVDWGRFDAALIRSTWDYLDHPAAFLAVLGQIEASPCRLYNPLEAVRWNMDKHYLFDLEQGGAPIVPTYRMGDLRSGNLTRLFAERNWDTVVLKPALGLGAAYSYRAPLEELEITLAGLNASQPRRTYLIQPFVEDVVREGEWSFVFFNGQFSHAMLKKPAPDDYRVQEIYGGTVQPAEPAARDLRQAEAVLEKLPFDLLYARLDFIRVGGELAVIEVELIEPIFSFNIFPESTGRFVQATRAKLAAV